MKRKRIAVIFGGASPEHGVSLASARAVLEALDRELFEAAPVGITREGAWYLYAGPPEALEGDGWLRDRSLLTPVTVSLGGGRGFLALRDGAAEPAPVDAAFPVLHGRNGEDGTVQGLLELAGIPVVGCGVLASAVCMDKDRAHRLAASAGVEAPEAVTFTRRDLPGVRREAESLGFPVYVKPLRAGSSFGVTRVTGPEGLEGAVEAALRYDTAVTVEREVPGFEVGCAVLGTSELTLGRVDQVEVTSGFFGFQEKYGGRGSRIHLPARITPETERRIQETAVRIYRVLGCSGFARVDMFLTPDGRVVFNEVNTVPGLTAHSRYPAMMRAAGIPFTELLTRLIGGALDG